LPRIKRTFALGIDVPLYFSVHSRWARLARAGGTIVHAAKYLPCDRETDAEMDRLEIERYLDLVQPGWRQKIAHQRFLPSMTVTYALPRAAEGGLEGRPSVDAPAVSNVYLAGDWVGQEGMLADAAFGSARYAAGLLAARRQLMLHGEAV